MPIVVYGNVSIAPLPVTLTRFRRRPRNKRGVTVEGRGKTSLDRP